MNDRDGVQYTLRATKYIYNQLNCLFSQRKNARVTRINWGALLCKLSRDILRKAKGDHLVRVHSDEKVLEMIRWEGWSLLSEAKSLKLAQGTIRFESTEIRWFSSWPGGRLVRVTEAELKGYTHSNESRKTTLGSQES
jgi:hypothetical protein